MRKSLEDDEKTSLLGKASDDLNPTSYKTSELDPVFSPPSGNRKIESITYTWNNINVWIGTESTANLGRRSPIQSQSPDIESGSIQWPWKKSANGVSKQILSNVSGIVRPGELLAIMGASGAGKTTLLNILTFKNGKKLRVSGTRRVNGVPVDLDTLTALSAYVQQDDLFIGSLTVKEHLIFQALLRMHRHIPMRERMLRVEEVIQEFGLMKCADTLIGEPGRIKGISGGEMKRLAFASEVLTDPLLMFCDEPTSGLDSFMAQNTVSVLRDMAQKGKTIVCTIHQPSSELYAMFDQILLMAEGSTAFLGNAKDAVNFFKEQGFLCPTTFNPADYFIETLAVQPGNEQICLNNIAKICSAFEESEAGKQLQNLSSIESSETTAMNILAETSLVTRRRSPYKASWFSQFRATLWRSWLIIKREPMILRARLVQTVITSTLMSVIYWGQQLNQDGVMNLNGAIFLFLTNMTFMNVFAVINVFCSELRIFLREHFNGMYRTDVYFLSKTLAEFPLFIIFPIIFTSICYFTIGLNPDFTRFFSTCGIVILVSNAACSFGYFVSCISPSVTVALSVAAPAIIPLMIFGGFFLNQASVPVYFVWLKYLSWFMYGNEALLINQWEDVGTIACNRNNATCPANGEVILQTYNFNKTDLNFDLLMLVVLLFVYRIFAYFALLAKTYRH